jgi:hypothetical protein
MSKQTKKPDIEAVSPIYCQNCMYHTNKPSYCLVREEHVARKQRINLDDGRVVCEDFKRRT